MNAAHRDPVFESLDRLAGLADHDLSGDRMPDIRRRVRATRRRRATGVAVAAAAVVATGIGLTQLPSETAEVDPAPPVRDLNQSVVIDAVPVYSDLVQVRLRIEGRASAYTDATTGTSVPAGPLSIQVVVDGTVVKETEPADVTCESGGEVTTYTVDHPTNRERVVPAMVSGPGEHVIEVRAPYCADGELVDEVTTTTVTTEVGASVVRDERTADLDGDGEPDTVQIVAPAEGERGDWQLVVDTGGAKRLRAELLATSEWSLQDPQDLDGDGTAEVLLAGGGGEFSMSLVYQLDAPTLRLVPTRNEAGADEPLSYGVSDTGPQNVSFQIQLIDEGFMSFRFLDAAPTRPAAVEVRRWVLVDGVLTLQDATEPGCVDTDFRLTLGSC